MVMQSLHAIKKDIIDIGSRMYARGYVAANDGNISVRLDDSRLIITPTGVSKGYMRAEELVLCDMDGRSLTPDAKPSSEILLHLEVYRRRPDISAVVHAHPPFATAFGITGIPLTQAVLPEVILTLGGIPLVEYGTPGSRRITEPLIPKLPDNDAFILRNHGALTIGKTLIDAYFRMETVEHFAYIAFISHLLGNIQTLPTDEVAFLLKQRSKLGFPGDRKAGTCDGDQESACSILQPGATFVQPSENRPAQKNSREISSDEIQNIVISVLEQFHTDQLP